MNVRNERLPRTLSDQRTAIAALQAAAERLSTSDALQVLDAARSRDDVATAAVLQLASLTDREPRAYDTLFELLDDDTLGGAAALALSRSESAQSLADIRALILGSQSETKRLRAALALRLSDSNASRALAAELRDARDLDDDLRRALL